MQVEKALDEEIIRMVERELRNYPDWLVRINLSGLGSPSRYGTAITKSTFNFRSIVENTFDAEEEAFRKVAGIEGIYDVLNEETKELIRYKYFQDHTRDEVLKKLKISKRRYYTLRDRALERFARALGYIN